MASPDVHRDQRVHEMYELYEQGASMSELAQQFGVSKSTVSELFRNTGLKTRPGGLKSVLADHPVEELYELYERGASTGEVAEQFGISERTVRRLFNSAGLERRSPRRKGVLAEHPVEELYELYEQGATLEEIGICFDVSGSLVQRIFQDAGLTIRSRSEAGKRYTDQELLDCLTHACTTVGFTLTRKEYEDFAHTQQLPDGRPWPGFHTYTTRFGGWSATFQAAGVKQHRRPRDLDQSKRYSDAELTDCLQRAQHALGGVLTQDAYNEYARGRSLPDSRAWPLWQTARLRFGSWRNALLATGLPANPSAGPPKRFDQTQCVQAVRAVAQHLGKTPTHHEYDKAARDSKGALPSVATVSNRCGSWSNALRLADV